MSYPQPVAGRPTTESWEDEGGRIVPEALAESFGVVRHIAETFSVGDYRYTSLADAVAQARRMIKLEQSLL